MPYIDLTTGTATPIEEDEVQTCGLCNKPFQHCTKSKKIKGQEPLVEMIFITCHPECTKAHAKMEKINKKIVKAKKVLHDLRTSQLNLEFEMFMKQQLKMDEHTDEIFLLLKEKKIL